MKISFSVHFQISHQFRNNMELNLKMKIIVIILIFIAIKMQKLIHGNIIPAHCWNVMSLLFTPLLPHVAPVRLATSTLIHL